MSFKSILFPRNFEERLKTEKMNCLILSIGMFFTCAIVLCFCMPSFFKLFKVDKGLALIETTLALGSFTIVYSSLRIYKKISRVKSYSELKSLKFYLLKVVHICFFIPYLAMVVWLFVNEDAKWGAILLLIWAASAFVIYFVDIRSLLKIEDKSS